MQILSILFSLKLTSVFTAERWLHHQVSRMINVWAIKLFACRDDHSQNADHSTHRKPACFIQRCKSHRTSADTPQPTLHLIHKEKIIYPLLVWLGEQLYTLRVGQYLWTFSRCPPESRHYEVAKLPRWSSCSEISLLLTIKLSCITAKRTIQGK